MRFISILNKSNNTIKHSKKSEDKNGREDLFIITGNRFRQINIKVDPGGVEDFLARIVNGLDILKTANTIPSNRTIHIASKVKIFTLPLIPL